MTMILLVFLLFLLRKYVKLCFGDITCFSKIYYYGPKCATGKHNVIIFKIIMDNVISCMQMIQTIYDFFKYCNQLIPTMITFIACDFVNSAQSIVTPIHGSLVLMVSHRYIHQRDKASLDEQTMPKCLLHW